MKDAYDFVTRDLIESAIRKHGGARPGSGRKALDPDGTVVTTIRLTGAQRATFDMIGGVEWLRAVLDQIQAAGE